MASSEGLPLENLLKPTAVSRSVDKNRIAEAVKLENDGTSVNFASGSQLLVNEVVLKAINICQLGAIQVPVSLRVLSYLIYFYFSL